VFFGVGDVFVWCEVVVYCDDVVVGDYVVGYFVFDVYCVEVFVVD